MRFGDDDANIDRAKDFNKTIVEDIVYDKCSKGLGIRR